MDIPKTVYRVEVNMRGEIQVYNESGRQLNPAEWVWLTEKMQSKVDEEMTFASIYFATDGKFTKIGVSKDIDRRKRELGVNIWHTVDCPASVVYSLERKLHVQLAHYNECFSKRGKEWFDFTLPNGQMALDVLKSIRNKNQLVDLLDCHALLYICKTPDVAEKIINGVWQSPFTPANFE